MTYLSRTKEYRARYWKEYRKKKKPYKVILCSVCGGEFHKKEEGNPKTCDKCRKGRCKLCGSLFKRNNLKQMFCSQICGVKAHPEKTENLIKHRGTKPRTYHLRKRPKHGGVVYNDWRLAVWKRDKFICQNCKKTANELKKMKIKIVADHIKPYCNYPKLRYELSNGRTLCLPCHKLTPTYGSKARNF